MITLYSNGEIASLDVKATMAMVMLGHLSNTLYRTSNSIAGMCFGPCFPATSVCKDI